MTGRNSRQILFSGIGKEGQKKLSNSSAVIIGCGALGTVIATSLVRAGVGKVRIIDRDFVENHNLQRQVLFNEDDVKAELPKAIAAERHLSKVNSSVEVEGVVADVNYTNIERLVNGADVILDGLDNLETRFLINDVSLKHKIPWVYGGVISSYGMTMTIVPHQTPCFRCILANPTRRGMLTCDTVGVISPVPFIIGSLQTVEAMKILVGFEGINHDIIKIDAWKGDFKRFQISRRADCPACHGEYGFLEGRHGERTTSFCGENSVQVLNPELSGVSFEKLSARLGRLGEVSYNEFLFRFQIDNHEMVIFPDGRAIVKNTNSEALARELYDKYIGIQAG